MSRPPRLALYLLLVLMQVLAPWMHAHTGVETGGFLHLPGLEFLANQGAGGSATAAPPGERDVIVGMQAGLSNRSDAARFAPDRQAVPVLSATPLAFPSSSPRAVVAAEYPRPPFRFSRHTSRPRASPASPPGSFHL